MHEMRQLRGERVPYRLRQGTVNDGDQIGRLRHPAFTQVDIPTFVAIQPGRMTVLALPQPSARVVAGADGQEPPPCAKNTFPSSGRSLRTSWLLPRA
jgi:hypothetical protein